MNIFEKATRKKLRFGSSKGFLSVENLWDLPLTGGSVSLNEVAKAANAELKAMGEENFVDEAENKGRPDAELRLEIVKHIIAVKKDERDKRQKAAERDAERRRLLQVLDRKNDEELEGMSKEDIKKRLEELE